MSPLLSEWEVAKNAGPGAASLHRRGRRSLSSAHTEGKRASEPELQLRHPAQGRRREYLGGCGVGLRENGDFELGYWLGKPYWGHGYATEAAQALARMALMELEVTRLIAGWFHDNPASGRVLEKLGFVPNGAEQRDCVSRGHAVYCNMMLLTPEHFAVSLRWR